jgi:ABC-type multidrug transport system ATPase subunit
MTDFAIHADGLAKAFGGHEALRDLNLRVPTGSIVCMLGRNGAGKTTTVRILTTLLRADSGRAVVAGFDTVREPERVRARIGVAAQGESLDKLLTGRQNLELLGRLYQLRPAWARARAGQLLDEFGLTDAADRLVRTYSGGMRRRLDLAVSLLPDPQVLFLDEPSTGLDPVSRRSTWQTVRDCAARGTSVLLTTQDMEEASQLADTIAVLAGGTIVATGTPAELTAATGQARIRVTLPEARPDQQGAVMAALGPDARAAGRVVTAPAPNGLASLAEVVGRLTAYAVEVHDVAMEHPSLNEVWAALTADPDEQPSGEPELLTA